MTGHSSASGWGAQVRLARQPRTHSREMATTGPHYGKPRVAMSAPVGDAKHHDTFRVRRETGSPGDAGEPRVGLESVEGISVGEKVAQCSPGGGGGAAAELEVHPRRWGRRPRRRRSGASALRTSRTAATCRSCWWWRASATGRGRRRRSSARRRHGARGVAPRVG